MSSTYVRRPLPQPEGPVFITDGGLETTLVFHDGLELPGFNSSVLLRDAAGQSRLCDYYRRYAEIARRHGAAMILETPTWRAHPAWLKQIGVDPSEAPEFNRIAVALLNELRAEYDLVLPQVLVSGCVGPMGDGYAPENVPTPEQAEAHHRQQVAIFADGGVDFVSAMTITSSDEAIGIVRVAVAHDIPVTVSFTVETDGRLPTGQSLPDAIAAVDAATDSAVAYYMINCAHPTHFESELRRGGTWLQRVLAIRANASSCSHAELNESPTLDEGDPADLGRRYAELQDLLPHLSVFGGCCGTDHRHVGAVCAAVTERRVARLSSTA